MPHLPSQIHLHLFLHPHILFSWGVPAWKLHTSCLILIATFFQLWRSRAIQKTKIVTASSSFNKLTMARSSFFLEFKLVFMPFKAFYIAFFTAFLEAKYFSTSLASSILLPCLLRRVDWSSRVHSFVCNNASLAIPHTSKSLSDPSNSSLNHFWFCSWAKACAKGNRSKLSTESFKSWRPIIFWLNDADNEVLVVASEHLNLLNWLSNSEMSGCALVGKLLERKWWREVWLTGEATVFS